MKKTKEQAIKDIMELPIDVKLDLTQYNLTTSIESIKFDQNSLNAYVVADRGLYSWVGEIGWRNLFPMRDSNYVKQFKTLKGAKRNFIKNYIERS